MRIPHLLIGHIPNSDSLLVPQNLDKRNFYCYFLQAIEQTNKKNILKDSEKIFQIFLNQKSISAYLLQIVCFIFNSFSFYSLLSPYKVVYHVLGHYSSEVFWHGQFY